MAKSAVKLVFVGITIIVVCVAALFGYMYYTAAQEKSAFEKAMAAESAEACSTFLAEYPGSEFATEVQAELESLDWMAAETANTIQAYAEFKGKHPDGAHIADAVTMIETIEMIRTCPLKLIPHELIELTQGSTETTITMSFKAGGMSSIGSGDWTITGLNGKALETEQSSSGDPMSGNFSMRILWADQPFEVHHLEEIVATFNNTEEYWKMRR